MNPIQSFPPISNKVSRVLILGSIPGNESLLKNEYYAHPRNSFWRIMGALLETPEEASYLKRTNALLNGKFALWDVLKGCTRESSLDSDIVESSITCNDFREFYVSHPNISKVFFNGAKAEAVYMKYVHPDLPAPSRGIQRIRLPSTSPANARKTLEEKIDAWKAIVS